MDVTRSNFEKAVAAIEAVLPTADFVSVDLEFTGLSTTVNNTYLDTYEQIYAKYRANVVQFQIIQIGLSIFKVTSEEERGEDPVLRRKREKGQEFDCYSFNFYIFPRPCRQLERADQERFFLSQASSLSFLAEHGFDFNRLIMDGVSYLNLAQVKLVKERPSKEAEQQRKGATAKGADRVTITNGADREFVEEVMRQIGEFAGDQKRTELALPLANPFRRRLMYEALADSPHAETIELRNLSSDRMKLTALRTSPELRAERDRRDELDMIGFSEVIRLLIKHRKPLVGHNFYLDLLFIYNTFLEPLPEDYRDFKILFHSLFPVVYDTRFLSANNTVGCLVGSNSLGNLYEGVLKSPFHQTVINLKNEPEAGAKRSQHEAGYDSFITGAAFINIARYMVTQALQELAYQEDMFISAPLAAYRNRVGIFRSLDLRAMNLEAVDRMPERPHVFHLTFPREWKRENIAALFSGAEIGGLQATTFIDETSAYVTLKDPGAAKKVVELYILKGSPTPQPFKITTYDDHVAMTSGSQESNGSRKARLSTAGDSNLLQPSAAASSPPSSPPLPKKVKKIKTEQTTLPKRGEESASSDTESDTGSNKTPKNGTVAVAAAAVVIETSADQTISSNSCFDSSGIVPLLKKRLRKNATTATATATATLTTKANTRSTRKKEAPHPKDNLFNVPAWAKHEL